MNPLRVCLVVATIGAFGCSSKAGSGSAGGTGSTGGVGAAGGGTAGGSGAAGGTAGGGGSSGSGGAAGGSGTTVAQACSDDAKLRCSMLDKCQPGLGGGVARHYPDMATCLSLLTESCTAALGAPGTAATADFVEACVQARSAQSCSDFQSGVTPSACLTPKGTVATGAACSVSAQCASGFCNGTAGTLCGVCADAPIVGTTCANNSDCGQILLCSTNKKCATPIAIGGMCDDDNPCINGAVSCVSAGADAGTSGTCQAQVQTAGAACSGSSTGAPDCSADYALTCMAKKCVADTAAAVGAACGADTTAKTDAECVGGATCEGSKGAKICVAAATGGQACDTGTGPSCLGPSTCIGTKLDGGTTGTCSTLTTASCP